MTRRLAAALAFAALAPLPASGQTLDAAMKSVVSVLPEWPPDARRTEEPEASGVVVFEGRTIVTALHAVGKARSVRVRTSDGEILPAQLAGRDMATDIAILTVERALPPIQVETAEPRLGDKVCAVGNAFGLGLSVACGVVSGVHRAGMGFNPVEDFVQTDAAVNPGASGGALVRENGKLVGLLSAIFTKQSDANIGVNFAVSAPLMLKVARQLRDQGRTTRRISGLRLEQAPGRGETGRQGARVAAVRPGSLGEKAGLMPGDVIISAGGRRIRVPADFVSVMAGLEPDAALKIAILRDGKEQDIQLGK